MLIRALIAGFSLVWMTSAAFAQPRTPERFSLFSSEPADSSLALVVPLSGAQAAAGQAVRDGFLAAASAAGDHVRVFDAGSNADVAVDVFERVRRSGPAVVVGPLQKGAVTEIADDGPDVPWVALNYPEVPVSVERALYFGLAPEDEARAAAEQAMAQGLRRALVLVPEGAGLNDWSERALMAFTSRLVELGGETTAVGRYRPGTSNFAAPLKQLMGLDASNERKLALANTLGGKLEFEPRRRDDADFIFLAARAEDARLLWPQLRFHRLGDLPAFTTSAVAAGGADQELNGLRVCDIPYLQDAAGVQATLRVEAGALSSAQRQPRLFAMGHDAYALAARLRAGEDFQTHAFAAATGILQVQAGSVRRRLHCAEYRDGRPVPPKRAAGT